MSELFTASRLTEEDWLARKEGKIGGSQAAAALGLNPFMTPLKLWTIMTGRTEREPMNNAMEMGLTLEATTIEMFEEKTGLGVMAWGSDEPMLWESIKNPFHVYSPDGVIEDPDRGLCLYEGKTGSADYIGDWTATSVPEHHYFQGMWGCAMNPDLAGVWFGAFLGGRVFGELGSFHFRHAYVPRSDKVCEMMIEKVGAWVVRHIEGDEPPLPAAGDAAVLKALYPHSSGKMLEISSIELDGTDYEIAQIMRDRVKLKLDMGPTIDTIDTIESILKLACGEADGIECPDGSRYTNKSTKPSVSIDQKLLKAEDRAAYDSLIDRFPAVRSHRRPYYRPTQEG